MRRDVLSHLDGESCGEVWSIFEKVTHLTLSLSFQERGPALPARYVTIFAVSGPGGGRYA